MASPRDWDRAGTEHTGVVPIEIVDEKTGPIALSTRLICVAGEDLGVTFHVTTEPLVLGRGRNATVHLHSNEVSRRHAELSIKNGELWLLDLESANGTFVNGARINGGAPVKLGDRIQIGNTIWILAHYDQLEARMQQAQRVEAMAAVAGGLAHDFRNALTVIVAGLEMFSELLPADASELRETTSDMKNAATAATALATRLLNLGRREPTAYDLVNLLDVIDDTAQMTRHHLGRRIRLSINIGSMMIVRGSRDELHQVIMNFLVNAKDAMPDGGDIWISAEVVRLERATALAHHLPSKGAYVELTIKDTGVGMDESTMARAFEPYFTTKPPSVGSGLGLTVIHGIVKRHGGSVMVESACGLGTTFRVFLPLVE